MLFRGCLRVVALMGAFLVSGGAAERRTEGLSTDDTAVRHLGAAMGHISEDGLGGRHGAVLRPGPRDHETQVGDDKIRFEINQRTFNKLILKCFSSTNALNFKL